MMKGTLLLLRGIICGEVAYNSKMISQTTGLFGCFDQHNPSLDKWRMDVCVIKATY